MKYACKTGHFQLIKFDRILFILDKVLSSLEFKKNIQWAL